MKAEITITQLAMNHSLQEFFLREQSNDALDYIRQNAKIGELNSVYRKIEEKFDDIDDFEEWLHDTDYDDIVSEIGEEYFI